MALIDFAKLVVPEIKTVDVDELGKAVETLEKFFALLPSEFQNIIDNMPVSALRGYYMRYVAKK
jgi:hypothetical protein